jgi:hypothetical protein
MESEKRGLKKVVGRNVAITLGIICVILGGVLSGSIYNYMSIISSKDYTSIKVPKMGGCCED